MHSTFLHGVKWGKHCYGCKFSKELTLQIETVIKATSKRLFLCCRNEPSKSELFHGTSWVLLSSLGGWGVMFSKSSSPRGGGFRLCSPKTYCWRTWPPTPWTLWNMYTLAKLSCKTTKVWLSYGTKCCTIFFIGELGLENIGDPPPILPLILPSLCQISTRAELHRAHVGWLATHVAKIVFPQCFPCLFLGS